MGRSKLAQRSKLHLEFLEQRRVFASLMMYDQFVHYQEVPLEPAFVLANYATQKAFGLGWEDADLKTFASQEELDIKIADAVTEYWSGVFGKEVNSVDLGWYMAHSVRPEFLSISSASMIADSRAANVMSFDLTNRQHAAIDEADSVEVTGDGYLFIAQGGRIKVVDARDPAALKTIKVMSDEAVSELRMFVVGDRLLTVGNLYDHRPLYDSAVYHTAQKTRVQLYDISDRSNPTLLSTTAVDGRSLGSTVQDGRLTLVQSTSAVLPAPLVVKGSDGKTRFEVAADYLARHRTDLLSALMPNYQQGPNADSLPAGQDIGQWSDFATIGNRLDGGTTVLRFDLDEDALGLIGSEVLSGLVNPMVYMAPDNIYLVARQMNNDTDIYRIETADDGQLTVSASVEVLGFINETRWMDEHNGVLRVATASIEQNLRANGFEWTRREQANIFTIGDTPNGWKVLGELKDIAPGERMLSAYFDGERALVTTGETIERFIDPLHGIDLSDPAAPKELSELTIPGFTTYLQRIDETHWVGLGYELSENRTPYLQVSLYEAADLANPRVVDRWTSSTIEVWGNSWNALDIRFDSDSGILTLGSGMSGGALVMQMFPPQAIHAFMGQSAPIFKIDVNANDPLQLLAEVPHPESIERNFVLDDVLYTISSNAVSTHAIDNLSGEDLDREVTLGVQPSTLTVGWSVSTGETQQFRLFGGWDTSFYTITSLTGGEKIAATLGADQSIIVSVPEDVVGVNEVLTMTVRYFDGQTATVQAYLWVPGPFVVVNPIDPIVTKTDAKAKILSRLENEAGEVIHNASVGDEVWVVVSAQDGRDGGTGVFAAYVDVAFNSANFSVVGQPEALGEFTSGKGGLVSEGGIKKLGGFSNTTTRKSTDAQDFARFKIRVTQEGPITLTFSPNAEQGAEFLVYDIDAPLALENIETSVLTTGQTLRTTSAISQDVNSDGVITALDALLIVNRINSQADRSASATAQPTGMAGTNTIDIFASNFDLNGDGAVSGLDVLQIINTINQRSEVALVGESEAGQSEAGQSRLAPISVDAFYAETELAIAPGSEQFDFIRKQRAM
ncbi:MAG: beta-propeller domain-containing protein [Pirellulaceae bacterium]|nr:beta-propeller domain-containing protein [Pirellulaceae bacterium]